MKNKNINIVMIRNICEIISKGENCLEARCIEIATEPVPITAENQCGPKFFIIFVINYSFFSKSFMISMSYQLPVPGRKFLPPKKGF
jgi:hypothetical protein